MPSIHEITAQQLPRLIGLLQAPRLVDLRHDSTISSSLVRLFALGLLALKLATAAGWARFTANWTRRCPGDGLLLPFASGIGLLATTR